MRTIICLLCFNPFSTKHKGLTKYCPDCRPIANKLKDQRRGIKRRERDAIPCPECGKPMTPIAGRCRSCWQKTAGDHLPHGPKHHWYKNGRPKTSEGYIRIKQPNHPFADHNGYVLEHRFVMEQHLGRILDRKEFVHHLNGIRNDNRLANLAIMSPFNHSNSTLKKIFQKRIRDLEAEIAQQKLL